MAQIPVSQNCGNCKHFIGTNCRAAPPQVARGDERIGIADRSVWPTVTEADWCGSWTQDNPSAQMSEADHEPAEEHHSNRRRKSRHE